MKDLIVLISMIILGTLIFSLIAGNGNSIKTTLSNSWEQELKIKTIGENQ